MPGVVDTTMAQAQLNANGNFPDYDILSKYMKVKVVNAGRVEFLTVPEQFPKIGTTQQAITGVMFQEIVDSKDKINTLLDSKIEDMFQLHDKKWIQVKPFGDEPHVYWYVGFLTLNNKGKIVGKYSMNLNVGEWQNLCLLMDKMLGTINTMKDIISQKTLSAKQVRGYKWQWQTGDKVVFAESEVWYYSSEHAKLAGMAVMERMPDFPEPDPVSLKVVEDMIPIPPKMDWIEVLYIFALNSAVGQLKFDKCSACALNFPSNELEHKKEGGCQDNWLDSTTVYFDEAKAMVSETLLSDMFQFCWTFMGKKPENITEVLYLLKKIKPKKVLIQEMNAMNINPEIPQMALIQEAYKNIQQVPDLRG